MPCRKKKAQMARDYMAIKAMTGLASNSQELAERAKDYMALKAMNRLASNSQALHMKATHETEHDGKA